MTATSRMILYLAIILVSVALAGCTGDEPAAGESASAITVAAASDLRPAFDDLAALIEREQGLEIVMSYGSSGLLAEQVKGGAPFDLFASASTDFVDEVVESGRGIPGTRMVYATGRIVVWAEDGETPITGLTDPSVRHVAIANPTHAPYGMAARQALRSAGIYDRVEPKLVYGENVQDTLRLAQSGNADAAIVALSLAIAEDGDRVAVPAVLHAPIEQELIAIDRGEESDAAAPFVALLESDRGREVLEGYGFTVPDQAGSADGAAGAGG